MIEQDLKSVSISVSWLALKNVEYELTQGELREWAKTNGKAIFKGHIKSAAQNSEKILKSDSVKQITNWSKPYQKHHKDSNFILNF